jgi:lipopolysaccharide/colanic/teichoic acid biosynthesis glycosyltransferase
LREVAAMAMHQERVFQRALKRGLDVAVSGGALAALWPLLVGIGAAVRLDSPGPALFVQERAGLEGRPFWIYKFRTMTVGSEKGEVVVMQGDARVTRVGAFLRKTSLDELPQLLNILKGEMSLVGPRPTLGYQVEQYDEVQRKRLEMKPGVTGWVQIHGRNSLPWPKRIELDVWYVEHWSFLLDLEILLKTPAVVLFGDESAVYGKKENFEAFASKPEAG